MFKFILLISISIVTIKTDSPLNVLENRLEICSLKPLTGFTRSGKCLTNQNDLGSHLVCAKVTQEFLEYTKSMGNDLISPRGSQFPGLVPGDNWCLCVFRWMQAKNVGKQPPVILESTNIKTLDYLKKFNMSIEILKE